MSVPARSLIVSGPIGTGKTFMTTCFAGEIGIPCVKFLNFHSQWQGVTEGNLERIFNILKAMNPVAVIIDEADAMLGNRDASGDSGTSARGTCNPSSNEPIHLIASQPHMHLKGRHMTVVINRAAGLLARADQARNALQVDDHAGRHAAGAQLHQQVRAPGQRPGAGG